MESFVYVWLRPALACLLLAAPAMATAAEPFQPRDDREVLERVRRVAPARVITPAARPSTLQALMEEALAFAWAQLRALREDGDPRRAGAARAALEPWWDMPNPGVLLARGMLLQFDHEFDAALASLAKVPPAAPEYAQALFVSAAVRQVTGDYAGATDDCARLPRLSSLYREACLADLASLTGSPATRAEARRLLADLTRRAREANLPWQWLAVIEAEAAERHGDRALAEARYRAVMDTGGGGVYAKAAFADLLLDTGRAREAQALLERDHDADALLLRFAIAAQRTGDLRAPGAAARMKDRLAAAARRGDRAHGREAARFALDLDGDPRAALAHALENWSRQKEPADARLVLAAARASRRDDAAAGVRAFLVTRGVHDVRLSPYLP